MPLSCAWNFIVVTAGPVFLSLISSKMAKILTKQIQSKIFFSEGIWVIIVIKYWSTWIQSTQNKYPYWMILGELDKLCFILSLDGFFYPPHPPTALLRHKSQIQFHKFLLYNLFLDIHCEIFTILRTSQVWWEMWTFRYTKLIVLQGFYNQLSKIKDRKIWKHQEKRNETSFHTREPQKTIRFPSRNSVDLERVGWYIQSAERKKLSTNNTLSGKTVLQ